MILSFSISPASRSRTTFDPSREPSSTTMISLDDIKGRLGFNAAHGLFDRCRSSSWHVMTTETLMTLPPRDEMPA